MSAGHVALFTPYGRAPPIKCRKAGQSQCSLTYHEPLKGKIMAPDMRRLRLWSLAGSTAIFVLASGLASVAPASADDSVWDKVLGSVGLQDKTMSDGAIDYRPRAPIVVPPARDLPQPHAAGGPGGDWPSDPDVIARRRAAADSRRPAPPANAPQPVSPTPIKVKMKDCPGGTCADDSFWDKVKTTLSGGNSDSMLNGTEPRREFLYEPPQGYRQPVIPSDIPPIPKLEAHAEAGAHSADTKGKTPETPAAQPQPQQPQAQQPPAPKEHFGLW
jgi:hypothetical protein